MENYFEDLLRSKNLSAQKKSEIAKKMPSKADSLSDWEKFINTHHWKEVMYVCAKFIPEYGSEKDNKIWGLLCDRLTQIEQPIVSPEFIYKNSGKIIWVEENLSAQEVKNLVARYDVQIKYPCFVIETSGKLRGFALSPNLVVAGFSATSTYPILAIKKVKSSRLAFLTKKDSEAVEECFVELNNMMVDAGVPGCNYQWMIAPEKGEMKDPYEGYDVYHVNRLTYYEDDDYTVIFAKL